VKLLSYITKGSAAIKPEGLRCQASRGDSWTCNKLLAKKNAEGQIAGSFRCERCHQDIEVLLAPPRSDLKS
jgi:phage FluMu protein Com